jgi:hypothetical protein
MGGEALSVMRSAIILMFVTRSSDQCDFLICPIVKTLCHPLWEDVGPFCGSAPMGEKTWLRS